MKNLLLLVCVSAALFCCGKEYTVELLPVPGEEQIFFLDLAGKGADSATFQLTTSEGRKVPFSFDMRISREEKKGKFLSAVNGYYSKEAAPAAERRFERPGFLSFRSVPGAEKYIFKFKDGAKETKARPDPAVRGWWIELMRDPFLTRSRYISGRKDRYKMLPGGGVEFTYPIRLLRTGVRLDSRIDGRRIFALMRCTGPFSYFSVLLKNGVWPRHSAIACYFSPRPGVMQDICSEGILGAKDAHIGIHHQRNKRFIVNTEYVKGPAVIKAFHLQLPPIGRDPGVKLDSDLFNTGDTVRIRTFGGQSESAIPFESGSVKGLRYGNWTGKMEISGTLTDGKNKVYRRIRGSELSLAGIKPGDYKLTVTLTINGRFALKQLFPLQVQPAPFD